MVCRFSGLTATIFNGNGLVSRQLIHRLAKNGVQVVIGYRGDKYRHEKQRIAGDLGQIYFAHYNMKDENSLYEAMRYSNVVINLTGKDLETRNFSFMDVHCDGPRRMAKIARECGVKKFIHFSALNASPNPEPQVLKNGSGFLKSKWAGELAVREEFPEAIIFRPANIVGEFDRFLNHYTSYRRCRWTKKLAIWDYYHEVAKQPVATWDVTRGVYQAIMRNDTAGKTFQAVGPHRYNFYDLIEWMRACSGRDKLHSEITNLRWDFLMQLMISVASRLQKYPFETWERVELDCISDHVDPALPTLKDLGVELTPLELIIPKYGSYIPRANRVEIPFAMRELIPSPKILNVPQ